MKIKLSYWSANILIVIFLLSIWFLSSFGAGILFTEYLDKFQIGGFKVGFWVTCVIFQTVSAAATFPL